MPVAINRRMTSTSWNCARNFRQAGTGFSVASSFGPCCSRRLHASSVVRPVRAVPAAERTSSTVCSCALFTGCWLFASRFFLDLVARDTRSAHLRELPSAAEEAWLRDQLNREAILERAQTGWCWPGFLDQHHPVRSNKVAPRLLLMSRPPLLA